MTPIELDFATANNLCETYGTPLFIYDENKLLTAADETLSLPAPYGLTVRFAIKALPTRAILELFANKGLHFDASSGFEVRRLLAAGIDGQRISLSTQELPEDFAELVAAGVAINACSLNQLDKFGRAFPGGTIGLRFNPGLGSGGTNRTNVGGPASSFGIWKDSIDAAQACVARHRLTVNRIHSHIGSGSDPEVWKRVIGLNLEIVRAFPSVTTLNLGGGYKVARMPDETPTTMATIAEPIAAALTAFAKETGRQLHFEIEPGTFLVANAGAVLARIQDIVDTGPAGYTFYKLDTGMTEILRPSLYGAQHPIAILRPPQPDPAATEASQPVIVVGHCCESGDILTPAKGDAEALQPRQLPPAQIGDFALIGGAGAYCAAMAAKNYNSFPEAAEVLLRCDGSHVCIRKRQTLEQILCNEVPMPPVR